MSIPILYSVKKIERQLHTGEEPVLVMCSDVNTYVCKYMRTSATAYKMVCEFIGARMAKAWQLTTPKIAIVKIRPLHWEGLNISRSLSAPSIGSRWMEGVVDITPSTYAEIPANKNTLRQLLRIALFDFWIANEDRNANNANLMYDVTQGLLVSIDYGCILNTATFEYPLTQLTSTDTILWSDLFKHLSYNQNALNISTLTDHLKEEYKECIGSCRLQTNLIAEEIPTEWNISSNIVKNKLSQLFDEQWITETWNNFTRCLNENINYE